MFFLSYSADRSTYINFYEQPDHHKRGATNQHPSHPPQHTAVIKIRTVEPKDLVLGSVNNFLQFFKGDLFLLQIALTSLSQLEELYSTCPVYAKSRACFKPRLVTPCKFTSSASLSTMQRLNIA